MDIISNYLRTDKAGYFKTIDSSLNNQEPTGINWNQLTIGMDRERAEIFFSVLFFLGPNFGKFIKASFSFFATIRSMSIQPLIKEFSL